MAVRELIKRLGELPLDAEVEIEVHDNQRDERLFGPLWLVNQEGDEVNLFARQYTEEGVND